MVATLPKTARTRSSEELWTEGRQYLAGTDWPAAAARAGELAGAALACNIGWLAGEATDAHTAAAHTVRYARLAGLLGRLPATTWLEADAPHLGVDLGSEVCLRNLRAVASRLPAGRLIQIGAEDAGRTDVVLDTVLAAHREGLPVRATVQANLHRSEQDVDRIVREGCPVRLVKGGFRETPELALQNPALIDAAYARLARRLARARVPLTLATHDARMWQRLLLPDLPGVSVELLLGVLPEEALRLRRSGVPVRLYVPFGTDWQGYVAKRVSDAEAVRARESRAKEAS
ncbi:proline dehydrogenase family protein [Actinomycetota bacterium Odt1-20B]